MTIKMKPRKGRALSAGDFEPDDIYFDSKRKSYDRKTGQLCAQVQRTLAFLLETECADDCLQGFYVESVTPHPNAARLLVVLRQWDHSRAFDLRMVLGRLAELKGYWRTEIGGAINRKKTPDLAFEVLLDGGAP
jgi:ribosome-binding factor A